MSKVAPPFRADHVGSLLRPKAVLDARGAVRCRHDHAAEKRAVEDEAIAHAVRQVESVGMRSITDGEFRRDLVPSRLPRAARRCRRSAGRSRRAPTPPRRCTSLRRALAVTGPLRHVRDIQVDDFQYLASARHRPRRCRSRRRRWCTSAAAAAAIDIESYPDLDVFFDDLAAVLPRRDRRALRRRLPLHPARRHQPRLPLRSEDARRVRSSAATTPTSCRGPTPR